MNRFKKTFIIYIFFALSMSCFGIAPKIGIENTMKKNVNEKIASDNKALSDNKMEISDNKVGSDNEIKGIDKSLNQNIDGSGNIVGLSGIDIAYICSSLGVLGSLVYFFRMRKRVTYRRKYMCLRTVVENFEDSEISRKIMREFDNSIRVEREE